MQKSKTKVFVITIIALLISFATLKNIYAKKHEVADDWGVTITNDAKEINDTRKIKFEVQKNKDVVPGKIAPGIKATADIDVNLEKIDGFVDIEVEVDDSKLNKAFSLNTKFDYENVFTKKIERVKAGKTEKVLLELIWNENDIEDTQIGINAESIEIPVKIRVLQHI